MQCNYDLMWSYGMKGHEAKWIKTKRNDMPRHGMKPNTKWNEPKQNECSKLFCEGRELAFLEWPKSPFVGIRWVVILAKKHRDGRNSSGAGGSWRCMNSASHAATTFAFGPVYLCKKHRGDEKNHRLKHARKGVIWPDVYVYQPYIV